MKVSIIIPVYNLAKYIGKAIESCLAQDHKDLEIIVVNDGSTDASEDVISQYVHDPRVKYIKQKNGGVSAARNTGVSHATGEYLTFLDGDDYLSHDTISANVKYIQSQDERIDWVLFPMIRVDESGNKIDNIDKDMLSECRYTTDELIDSKELFRRQEAGKVAPCVWAAIFARNFFDVKFPPGRYEDTYVFLELIQKSPKVLISTKGTYYYLDRGDSFIRAKFDAQKWYDYTRTRIMNIQTGLKVLPEERERYQKQAAKTYYNLKYLKNKYPNDPAFGKPLELFLSTFPNVRTDFFLSAKYTLKSLLSKLVR